MRQMKILLIEDDLEHCNQYKKCITEQKYIHLLHIANGCKQGLELLQRCRPDIVLLDLELHNSDGDGILFLQTIKTMELGQMPYIIVITKNVSDRTHEIARKHGADYVFIKSKTDYSAQFVLDFAYNAYLIQNGEIIRIDPVQREDDIKDNIAKAIENLGLTSDMDGKDYLIDAIVIAIKTGIKNLQLNKNVYPVLARKYKKSDASIDRAITNAIKKAWRITDINTLLKNYTAEVDFAKGVPTNKELIFYFAEKLR